MQLSEVMSSLKNRRQSKIEIEIHTSPNGAKHSMNMALTAIGICKPKLTELVIKTADAIPYIQKALSRKKSRLI